MYSSSDSDDAEPPRKKRQYKKYLDATHPISEPPRTTVWNIESGEKQKQQQRDETSASCSHHSDCLQDEFDGDNDSGNNPEHHDLSNQQQRSKLRCAHSSVGPVAVTKGNVSPNSSPGGSFNDEINTLHSPRSEPSNPDRFSGPSAADKDNPSSGSSSSNSSADESERGGYDEYDSESLRSQVSELTQALCSGVSSAANKDDHSQNSSDGCSFNDMTDRDHIPGFNSDEDLNYQPEPGCSNSPRYRLQNAGNHAAGGDGPDPNSSPDGSSDDDSNHSNDSEDGGHFSDDGRHDIGDFSDMDSDNNSDEDARNTPPINNQPPQHSPPPPPDHRLRDKLRGEYSGRIEDNVAASRGEVLLNLQEFCKQHPQPLTAQEDLHKLINSMFYKEIVPETTYKLDKLYSTAIKIRYYFYCLKCFTSFGELPNYKEVRVKKCDQCNTDNIVHDLTKACFFIIIEFVDQLQLLLDDPKIAEALKNPNEFPDNGDSMKDLYDGSVYKNFVESLVFRDGQHFISFCACTDGTPLFRCSSSCSIWPIFISINELPPHLRMTNVLTAGLWFGKSHPKMDLFFEPLSTYIMRLSDPGFSLRVLGNVRLYKGYLLGMCMDSGARGSVQCVHCHMGESSCNWCLHPGEVEGGGSNARKFLQFDLEPAKRTTEQMIRDGRAVLELPGEDNHINGAIGLSPLLRVPIFDIVDGMVLDTLHWASFGIARRMGKLWLGETKKKKKKKANAENVPENNTPLPRYYVGTDATIAVIDSRISQIRPPREARRLLRDLSQIHDYNAREWENWTLYFSIPLFKNILPERYLKHWTLFVQGFYLLMKSNVTKDEIRAAGILMKMYVDGVEELYGRAELSFNMHISNHAADNALRWGNGWSVSMYAFENGNKCLKRKIHAERGIPHQVIRSLQRDSALNILRAEASTAQSDAFKISMARKEVKKSFYAGSVWCLMPKNFTPSREERWRCETKGIDIENFVQCTRIIFKNICYASDRGRSRTNNSFCCVDGGFVKIRNIIADERSGQVFLFVSKVRCTPYPLPPLPRTVTSVNFSPFLYNVDLIEEGSTIVSCEALEGTICVFMEVDCRFYKGKFLSVMSNTFNVF